MRSTKSGPTKRELEVIAAWWKAQRHIGRAAVALGVKRQTVANTLYGFRRREGATDNVELALKYLSEIEQRWAELIKRAA